MLKQFMKSMTGVEMGKASCAGRVGLVFVSTNNERSFPRRREATGENGFLPSQDDGMADTKTIRERVNEG
jgi:hypothetical protein